MTTPRSSQEWRDSWRERSPYLSWMQRHSKEIIAAKRPDQVEAFISKHTHHRFADEEIRGLRDGSIREAVIDWRNAAVQAFEELLEREEQEELARTKSQ